MLASRPSNRSNIIVMLLVHEDLDRAVLDRYELLIAFVEEDQLDRSRGTIQDAISTAGSCFPRKPVPRRRLNASSESGRQARTRWGSAARPAMSMTIFTLATQIRLATILNLVCSSRRYSYTRNSISRWRSRSSEESSPKFKTACKRFTFFQGQNQGNNIRLIYQIF